MKIFRYYLVLACLFLTISCNKSIDMSNEKGEVEQVLYKYAEAWHLKDIDLFSKLFSNDADMIIFDGNSSEIFVSWSEWKERLQKNFGLFENVDISYENENIKVSESGEFSWLSCIANTKYTYDGKPGMLSGLRMTWVLEKRNKNWIIVHAHFSFPKE
jgi:ketosteroid isomerase-like protein